MTIPQRLARFIAGVIADFMADDNSDLFKIKQKLTGQTSNHGTTDVEILLPLKYLSHVW